jgi:hypothetical protein
VSRNSYKGGKRSFLRGQLREAKAILARLDNAELLEKAEQAIKLRFE